MCWRISVSPFGHKTKDEIQTPLTSSIIEPAGAWEVKTRGFPAQLSIDAAKNPDRVRHRAASED